jgi:hypothetical protein
MFMKAAFRLPQMLQIYQETNHPFALSDFTTSICKNFLSGKATFLPIIPTGPVASCLNNKA